MDNPLMHYILLNEQIQFDGTIAKLAQKIAAVVGDTADKAIVEAIIAAARAEEVTDLYMIDKKFILDAIREKQELENQKPLTNGDRIRAMSDEELAEYIGQHTLCDRIQDEGDWCDKRAVCRDCLTDWLRQPVKGEP